jgi:hypothetical protein
VPLVRIWDLFWCLDHESLICAQIGGADVFFHRLAFLVHLLASVADPHPDNRVLSITKSFSISAMAAFQSDLEKFLDFFRDDGFF